MSYLLEALKKSDRERKQGRVPNLQSDHTSRSKDQKKTKKSFVWPWLAAVLLLAMSALVLYRGMQKDSVALQEKISALEKSVVQLKEQPKEQPAPVAVPLSEVREDASPQPFVIKAAGAQTAVPEVYEQPPVSEQTVIKTENLPRKIERDRMAPLSTSGERDDAAAEGLPLMQDLPASVQKILPPLKMAGHVYAKDAAKRMIMINNRICREGELVENQLYLEQIVWAGVVLRYQDLRFRVNLP